MRRRNINYKPSKQQAGLSLAVGVVFIFLGLGMVLPMTLLSGSPFLGLFGLAWTGIAVYNTVINAKYLFGQKDGENENLFGGYEITEEPSTPQEETHDHIPSTAPNAQKRLEQLKTLKEAGLITPEEYAEKRTEILKDL